ncbi:MAG: hypothetical protein ACYTEZ_17735 [Planctomycetota bacterium]
MIAACGSVVVHLGGWRGDRLFVAHGPGEMRPVAELGWDGRFQATPQRRLVVTPEEIFVLEPAAGPLLVPPLRVRRFDFDGRERGREEGAEPSAAADLYFLAERAGPGPVRLRRAGIDVERGRPLCWEGTLDVDLLVVEPYCSGTPLRVGETWWYPFREEALVRVAPDGVRVLAGGCAPVVERVRDRVICVGAIRRRGAGAWVDGMWSSLECPPLYMHFRYPRAGLVGAVGQDGLVVLRQEGGRLPALQGRGGRLPPEHAPYRGLVHVPGALLAVTEGEAPALVPVELL